MAVEGAAGETSAPRRDQRDIRRVPARLAVSAKGRSGVLGSTRDLSLGGLYLDTPDPLPEGARLPLRLELPDEEIGVEAEVVRRDATGMALRFVEPGPDALRHIRRFVTKETDSVGSRETAQRLHAVGRSAVPIDDELRIHRLLMSSVEASEDLFLFPVEGYDRERGRVEHVGSTSLRVRTRGTSRLPLGASILTLHTLDFVSYSFRSTVLRVDPGTLELALPTSVHYSERRNTSRMHPGGGQEILVPIPWDPGRFRRWSVLEASDSGLSFRADPQAFDLRPGMNLPDAELVRLGRRQSLAGAEIRHVTRVGDGEGMWLKVGVALQRSEVVPFAHVAEIKAQPTGFLRRWWERLSALWGQRRARQAAPASGSAVLITIGPGTRPLMGLLNRTWTGEERQPAPLVIVIPGFAGRKETMSRMAMVLVDSFRRNYADLAVLRMDTSNNLGESWKDAGFEGDGRHTLHHTTSGTVADIEQVLRWARNNPWVDASTIVLVSVSFGAVPVRHALTQPWARDVRLWVSYMGSPDVRDSVLHVTGHLDMVENAARGQPSGVVAIAGTLVDVDHFYDDAARLQVCTLEDACREMARVPCDVLWFLGRYDGFMDPRRVEMILRYRPEGARRDLVTVESGHIPRAGPIAIQQFEEMARRIGHSVLGRELETRAPPLPWLEEAEAREWRRVRRIPRKPPREFWRDYLLGGGGAAFDVLCWAPPYQQFMRQQAERVDGAGLDVLELGAGTGNLTVLLAEAPGVRLVATDLVPEALDRARQKLTARGQHAELQEVDADGSIHTLLRRWVSGELNDPAGLFERLPGVPPDWVRRIRDARSDDVWAALRGCEVDLDRAMDRASLVAGDRPLLVELSTLARWARRGGLPDPLPPAEALRPEAFVGPRGLPFPDSAFDRVAASLLLSYLAHPEDTLAEARRVLRPGGVLVVSSLRLDADSSALFDALEQRLRTLPEAELPPGESREALLHASNELRGRASQLFRAEEEGDFQFYEGGELRALVARAGFVDAHIELGFGSPAQGVIVSCRKG